jgi:hypothetical protein
MNGRGNHSAWRKPAPLPLCQQQMPHDLTWAWNQADSVGSQWLTTWGMARPRLHWLLPLFHYHCYYF